MIRICLLALILLNQVAFADTLEGLRNSDTEGYARAIEVRYFIFPLDHAAHQDFQTEWWYLTGNLQSESGRSFGYQLTLFRNNIKAGFKANKLKSNQIYMGHFAISDIANKKFYSNEVFQREAFGLAGSTAKQTHLNNWKVSFDPFMIQAKHGDIALKLDLESLKDIVLQGNKGLSQKSNQKGNASYYYSMTDIASKGTVSIKGEEFDVTGKSWLDREWSTSALGKDQQGWDWFALQLDDAYDLMYYQLREKDGSSKQSQGSWVNPQSKKKTIERDDILIKVLDRWTSKYSKAKYPVAWQLKIPSENLDITIKAAMNNQEHEFQFSYWEGAVTISGTHNFKAIKGKGYVELTGY